MGAGAAIGCCAELLAVGIISLRGRVHRTMGQDRNHGSCRGRPPSMMPVSAEGGVASSLSDPAWPRALGGHVDLGLSRRSPGSSLVPT